MFNQTTFAQTLINTDNEVLRKIKAVKVTSIQELDFNSMEGQNYQVNVKLLFENGKYKLLKYVTNTTYLDDIPDFNNLNELQQILTEYWDEFISNLVA
jgi:hypothetical protein